MPEWVGEGLGCKISPGVLQRDPNPGDQGWTLARAGRNRGEKSQAGPQDSWLGLRRVTRLAQVQGSRFQKLEWRHILEMG